MPDLPTLNRRLVSAPDFDRGRAVLAPDPALLDLPVKAVQFGTGAFLRGFIDFFLDGANRQGRFGGRIVAVASTGSGRDQTLTEQDGLYTLAIQGVEGGEARREFRIVSSLARAVSAREQWGEVLELARDPALELVFSNTTEVGIVLDEEDSPDLAPPRSFPGKLARFLYERARAFDFDPARGVVVLPCELIEGNGDRLREIVLQLARRWELDARFARWLEDGVRFCNTLVDRIVPGTPDAEHLPEYEALLGYHDGLLTTCEIYRLFAIEGDEDLARRLPFAGTDPGIIVTPDVQPYRERKVRLLNGTHTIMVPAAILAGLETVSEAMRDERIGRFVRTVMYDEIVPSLDASGAKEFADAVIDRFSNPYIRHALLDITLQATMKMRVRIVPSLLRYVEKTGRVPASIAFGFAAFLLFMRGDVQERARQAGHKVPPDEQAERFRALWNGRGGGEAALGELVRAVCADRALWNADLTEVPGFAEAVTDYLVLAEREGMPAALDAHLAGERPAALG